MAYDLRDAVDVFWAHSSCIGYLWTVYLTFAGALIAVVHGSRREDKRRLRSAVTIFFGAFAFANAWVLLETQGDYIVVAEGIHAYISEHPDAVPKALVPGLRQLTAFPQWQLAVGHVGFDILFVLVIWLPVFRREPMPASKPRSIASVPRAERPSLAETDQASTG